jgi:hypothetical protein
MYLSFHALLEKYNIVVLVCILFTKSFACWIYTERQEFELWVMGYNLFHMAVGSQFQLYISTKYVTVKECSGPSLQRTVTCMF